MLTYMIKINELLVIKRGNLEVLTQRHVIVPFVSYLRSSDMSIRKASKNRLFAIF